MVKSVDAYSESVNTYDEKYDWILKQEQKKNDTLKISPVENLRFSSQKLDSQHIREAHFAPLVRVNTR